MSKPFLCRLGLHKKYVQSTHTYEQFRTVSVLIPDKQFELCKCCDYRIQTKDYRKVVMTEEVLR